MNSQLEHAEARLRADRDKLLADIRDRLHASGEPDKLALVNHLETAGDWIEASVFADDDIALLRHELDHLAEIDGALARIRDGSYGTCRECGEPIAAARIEAQPAARCCLACQQESEARASAMRA